MAGGAAPSNGPWTFIVRRALGIRNAGELDGAYICLVSGSASETAVTGYFQAKGMAFGPIAVSSEQQAISGYEQNDCDVLVRDARDASVTLSGLARPSDHVILADQIGGSSASAPAPVRPALPQPVDVAYPLQSELKRLGCLTGPVDGIWGGGSRAALQRFSGQAGLNLGSEPSQNAVDEARSRPAGFCQPVQVAPPPPVTYTPSQPVPPTVTKKKRCSAVKYAFTRGNTCACSDRRIFTGSACVRP